MKKSLIALGILLIIIALFNFTYADGKIVKTYWVSSTADARSLGVQAAHQGDSSLCDVIRSFVILGPDSQYLKYNCYISYAELVKTTDACEKIVPTMGGDKNICYDAVAKSANDKSICLKIVGTTGHVGQCYAFFKNPPTNNAICDELTNEKDKSTCQNWIINKK